MSRKGFVFVAVIFALAYLRVNDEVRGECKWMSIFVNS